MPKIKSHSGAKKRFKRTPNGKWLHRKAGRRHLLSPDTARRGRILGGAGQLTKTEGKTMDKFLPYN